ncbi:MAG: indolepyruvate ferredoxin oxidoreductase subunit alpha [Armatimonadota bacterium]
MGRIAINQERCKGCGICVHFCPKSSISMSERLNSRGYHPCVFDDSGVCTGCGVCAIMCPDVAIEVYK